MRSVVVDKGEEAKNVCKEHNMETDYWLVTLWLIIFPCDVGLESPGAWTIHLWFASTASYLGPTEEIMPRQLNKCIDFDDLFLRRGKKKAITLQSGWLHAYTPPYGQFFVKKNLGVFFLLRLWFYVYLDFTRESQFSKFHICLRPGPRCLTFPPPPFGQAAVTADCHFYPCSKWPQLLYIHNVGVKLCAKRALAVRECF